MLAIPRFAHELGVDSVSINTLKAPLFTPIREMVESAPACHSGPGYMVYSDRYSISDIHRIRSRIKREFYTRMQIARVVQKSIRAGMFTPWEYVALPFRFAASEHHRKKWQREVRKQKRAGQGHSERRP
jgi:hypothetical protein